MKNLEDIKVKIAYYTLHQKLKSKGHKPVVTNFSKSENIGIVFNATYFFTFDVVKEFSEELTKQNKMINCLGYVHSKELIDHYLIRKGFDFYTRKSLNWYYKPIDPTVNQFIDKEFDLLIDLSLDEYYPVQYITALSNARFKVGKKMSGRNYTDLMLDIDKENKLRQQVRQEIESENDDEYEKSEFDIEIDRKSDYESELKFLITHIKHYLSIIK